MGRGSACAVSGLPISHGEVVMVLPMACALTSRGEALWLPVGLGLRGPYDERSGEPSSLSASAAGWVFSKAYGAASPGEWARSFLSGRRLAPPGDRAHAPEWISQAVGLVRPDAWAALLRIPAELHGRGELAKAMLDASAVEAAASEAAEWIQERRAFRFSRAAKFTEMAAMVPHPDHREAMLAMAARSATDPVFEADLPAAPYCHALFGDGVRRCASGGLDGGMHHEVQSAFWRTLADDASAGPDMVKAAVREMGEFARASDAMARLRQPWTPAIEKTAQLGGWAERMMWSRSLAAICEAGVAALPADAWTSPALVEAKALVERSALEIASRARPARKAGKPSSI